MKHWFSALILALLIFLPACGSNPAPTDTVESPEITDPVITEPPIEEYNGPLNPLTGMPIEEQWVNARPLAVMLNNLRAAQPQHGTSQADIIYEVLAEGGITRMVAVFQDHSAMPLTGSVRSTRPYYLDLAQGHDGILLHAGGSEAAYREIQSRGVTALDCVNGPYEGSLFWRDADRRSNLGYEHSVMTSGEVVLEHFPKYSFRQTHLEDYVYTMAFSPSGKPDGEPAEIVSVPFSSYKTGVFELTESGTYAVSQYGAAYSDGNSDEQVTVTNVLILEVQSSVIRGDTEGRLTVTLTGSGSGYFACGGAYIPITWEKADYNSQFSYYDTEGNPITLSAGSSYVCIVPNGTNVSFE